MQCYVYKSVAKADHFLYLTNTIDDDNATESIPTALLNMLGELSLVVEFQLSADRELPNADAVQVLADLRAQGFYLQMPAEKMHSLEERLFN